MLTKCKIKKIYYSKMTADLVYLANPPPPPSAKITLIPTKRRS